MHSALDRHQNKSGSKPIPVVIIGNGPSGICLSYLLSGYTPYFKRHSLHPHPILQNKLEEAVDVSILDQDLEYLSEGLEGRSNSPVALLFDTLQRPDTDFGVSAESVLTWRHEIDRAIPHLVLGKNPPGGAWHSIEGSMITLSRGEWMGLPDLQFKDWLKQKKRGLRNHRATAEDIAQYYQHYVMKKGLQKNFRCGTVVTSVKKIFRRADKNDDGKLSLEEFQAFFSDGTLNEEELEKLFHTIDSDNTNNVDTKELCDYFADHMGDYEDVLASLETLNLSILKAMDYTKRVYESGSNVDQFVTRFLLKETANQTQSLLSSVESAVDAIDEQTNPSRQCPGPAGLALTEPWYDSPVPSYAPPGRIVPRGHGKSSQSGAPEPRQDGLEGQIGRLAALIGRLEDKTLWFDLHQRLSDSESTACAYLLLVRDEMTVSHKHLGEFCSSLKQYLKSVAGERDCFHVTAVKLPDGVTFIVYEFWETEEDWKRHLQSATCKGFQHVKVDTLSQPEAVSSVAVPAAWCTLSQD